MTRSFIPDGPWSLSGRVTFPWKPLISDRWVSWHSPELENLWVNAIATFPDVNPLIELLRDDRIPMVPYARHSWADLLSPPTDPPIDAFSLELRVNKDFDRMTQKIFRVSEYNRRMAEGGKSEPTAQEVGRQFGNVQDRQVLRDKQEWEQTLAKDLRDRLRGIDPKAD
jgi:hypothetical protein